MGAPAPQASGVERIRRAGEALREALARGAREEVIEARDQWRAVVSGVVSLPDYQRSAPEGELQPEPERPLRDAGMDEEVFELRQQIGAALRKLPTTRAARHPRKDPAGVAFSTAQGPARLRLVAESAGIPERVRIACPMDACEYWRGVVEKEPDFDHFRERMAVLSLDIRSQVIGHHVVSTGSARGTCGDVAGVFRVPLACCAAKVIVIHNHPSGSAAPSLADLQLAVTLKKAAHLLSIVLQDFVVIGSSAYMDWSGAAGWIDEKSSWGGCA